MRPTHINPKILADTYLQGIHDFNRVPPPPPKSLQSYMNPHTAVSLTHLTDVWGFMYDCKYYGGGQWDSIEVIHTLEVGIS